MKKKKTFLRLWLLVFLFSIPSIFLGQQQQGSIHLGPVGYGLATDLSPDGLTMIVGSPRDGSNGANAGQVIVYNYDTNINDWVILGAPINGLNAGDRFGSSVAISKKLDDNQIRIVVGAPFSNGEGAGSSAGQVRIFEYDEANNTWIQLQGNISLAGQTQNINGSGSTQYLGFAVDINYDGSIVAYSAIGQNRVYLSQNQSPNTFWPIETLAAPGGTTNLGTHLNLLDDGLTIAISSGGFAGGPPASIPNNIFVFSRNGSPGDLNYYQIGNMLTVSNEVYLSEVDIEMSENGSFYLAVGNPSYNSERGNVRIYVNNGFSNWSTIASVDGTVAGELLGFSFDFYISPTHGLMVAVSSPGDDTVATDAGKVQVFYSPLGFQKATGNIYGTAANDRIGYSVKLNSGSPFGTPQDIQGGMLYTIGSPYITSFTQGSASVYNTLPRVTTSGTPPTNLLSTTAKVTAEVYVDTQGILEMGFVYSSVNQIPNQGNGDPTEVVATTTGTFNATLSNLTPATTYYARPYVINAMGTGYGEVISFTTPENDFLKVSLRILLEGPYGGENLMNDGLRSTGNLPAESPYQPGVIAQGTLFNAQANAPDDIVDWVLVELRDKTDPSIVVTQSSAFVTRSGFVTSITNATSPVSFDVPPDEYYIVVKHRNHIPIRTLNTYSFSSTTFPLDLSKDAETLLLGGINAVKPIDTLNQIPYYAMLAGDVDGNHAILTTDSNSLRSQLSITGYSLLDVDMNGTILITDLNKIIANLNRTIQF